MHVSMEGQTAIVTGGDSGLGRSIALKFAEAGACVVVNFHEDKDAAREVVSSITGAGGRAMAVQGDTGVAEDVERLFAAAVEEFDVIDTLVSNSGIQRDAAIADMSLEDWQAVLDTNLTGQFLCARSAIKIFRAQERRRTRRSLGNILCMSSVHDKIPWAGHINYAASKGGVSMLMKTLAQEVAGEGIRVNAIAPGAIRTPINEDAMRGSEAQKLLQLIPYGRIGEPEDVAWLALFLCSDMADYIVGATVYIDGGMSLYPGFVGNG